MKVVARCFETFSSTTALMSFVDAVSSLSLDAEDGELMKKAQNMWEYLDHLSASDPAGRC